MGKSRKSGRGARALSALAVMAAASCSTLDQGPGQAALPSAPPQKRLPLSSPLPPRLVEVIATDRQLNPDRILVEPGQPVILSLRNEGEHAHSIAVDLPAGRVELAPWVPPNHTGQIRFQAPAAPGDYVFGRPATGGGALEMLGTLTVREPPRIALQEVASGLSHPVALVVPPDGSGRRFIVDQIGVIRVLGPDGVLAPEPFLDMRDSLVKLDPAYDERGLLGLAFHPRFAQNGRFYIHYSAPLRPGAPLGYDHTNHLSELRVDRRDPDRAVRGTERVLMQFDHPQANHVGGTLAFGPSDGYLYISLGDGGGAGDQGLGHTPGIGNAQDQTTFLGSILRIDVDGGARYRVPPDNPLLGKAAAPEIYAYGFRNPYRMSFDMGGERRLYVGDAGQELWEEVSIVAKGGNYGWRILEGTHCFNPEDMARPPRTCASLGPRGEPLRWPAIEIPNIKQEGGLGATVVGGHVYRGSALPELAGRYVFGVWSASREHTPRGALLVADATPREEGELIPVERLLAPGHEGTLRDYLLGFGQDADGEIYALVAGARGPTGNTGRVLKLVPDGAPAQSTLPAAARPGPQPRALP